MIHDLLLFFLTKNIGPCILEQGVCIIISLKKHLLTENHRQLDREEFDTLNSNTGYELKQALFDSSELLSDAEYQYFDRALQVKYHAATTQQRTFTRIFIVVHKLCAVLIHLTRVFSKWLDHQLQKLLPIFSSFIKDSIQLLKRIKDLDLLSSNEQLFTPDARSIYTNIDIECDIETSKNDTILL